MVSKCLELGISCTYNRSRHSNDNAHMEASFRLLKHGHEILIPESFDSLSRHVFGLIVTMTGTTINTVTVASAI